MSSIRVEDKQEEVDYLQWMKDLFPINRSLSGEGNRQTLRYLKEKIPSLEIKEIPSGLAAFDWVVPDEWNIDDAFIECMNGQRFAEFKKNNLHVVGYSAPIDQVVTRNELLNHLHYLDHQPDAIPYVTSYYAKQWGFCIKKSDLQLMGEGPFRVYIGSRFTPRNQGGGLTYGELILPGKSHLEVLFSTYICHPSMANNELSGPVVATALGTLLSEQELHYTYRFLFLPETIGAVCYLSEHLEQLKKRLIAGWVLTCIGDTGKFSYIPSRLGNSYADRCTLAVLKENNADFLEYSWMDRGSDERQYCAPGVDLPVCSISRSKYGTYKEYHTSLDNLNLITNESLAQSVRLLRTLVDRIEQQRVPRVKVLCEPQLGKRGMYPNTSKWTPQRNSVRDLMNVISCLDGNHTPEEIASVCELTVLEVNDLIEMLLEVNLIDI
jgi:aminopeptidase-like protein